MVGRLLLAHMAREMKQGRADDAMDYQVLNYKMGTLCRYALH